MTSPATNSKMSKSNMCPVVLKGLFMPQCTYLHCGAPKQKKDAQPGSYSSPIAARSLRWPSMSRLKRSSSSDTILSLPASPEFPDFAMRNPLCYFIIRIMPFANAAHYRCIVRVVRAFKAAAVFLDKRLGCDECSPPVPACKGVRNHQLPDKHCRLMVNVPFRIFARLYRTPYLVAAQHGRLFRFLDLYHAEHEDVVFLYFLHRRILYSVAHHSGWLA